MSILAILDKIRKLMQNFEHKSLYTLWSRMLKIKTSYCFLLWASSLHRSHTGAVWILQEACRDCMATALKLHNLRTVSLLFYYDLPLQVCTENHKMPLHNVNIGTSSPTSTYNAPQILRKIVDWFITWPPCQMWTRHRWQILSVLIAEAPIHAGFSSVLQNTDFRLFTTDD